MLLLVMALFVFGLPFADSGFSGIAAAEAFGFAIVALLAIWLTYVGFGSIALWAFRFAWVQLAARTTRQRLWQTIGFLAVVAIVFVITTIRDEVRALRDDRAEQSDPAELLAGTPLAPSRWVNHLAREHGSACTCRYPRPSFMCRSSWPCCPACTSR